MARASRLRRAAARGLPGPGSPVIIIVVTIGVVLAFIALYFGVVWM